MNHLLRLPGMTPLIATLCLVFAVLAACSSEGDRKLPGVYRVDVQQGNIIDQEMIDKLRPGMDRNQVRFIMGTPAITDPFHADRWDYLFTVSERGRTREQRHVTLHFKDDKLTHLTGDVVPGERKSIDELEADARASSVEVPLERNQPGVFSRMFNALPFIGDDESPKKPKETEAADDSAQPAPAGEDDASGTDEGAGPTPPGEDDASGTDEGAGPAPPGEEEASGTTVPEPPPEQELPSP